MDDVIVFFLEDWQAAIIPLALLAFFYAAYQFVRINAAISLAYIDINKKHDTQAERIGKVEERASTLQDKNDQIQKTINDMMIKNANLKEEVTKYYSVAKKLYELYREEKSARQALEARIKSLENILHLYRQRGRIPEDKVPSNSE